MSTDIEKTNATQQEEVAETSNNVSTTSEEKEEVVANTEVKTEIKAEVAKKAETKEAKPKAVKKEAKAEAKEVEVTEVAVTEVAVEEVEVEEVEAPEQATTPRADSRPAGETQERSFGYNKERTYQNRGDNKTGGYKPNYQGNKAGGKRFTRRRVCSFCVNKVEEIDYIKLSQEITKSFEYGRDRDGERRPRYITEKGRIIPRRMSGICVKHQRVLATAIKRGRIMALLPFQND